MKVMMRTLFLYAALTACLGTGEVATDGGAMNTGRKFGAPLRIPAEERENEAVMNVNQTGGRPGALRPGTDFAHCIKVGVVVDQPMINLLGSEAKTREYFKKLMEMITPYYMREWSVKLQLNNMWVYNSWKQKNGNGRLDELQALFTKGSMKQHIEKSNVIIHATAKELDGGGIAWMEGLFSYKYQFGVVLGLEGGYSKWDRMVVAHEVGHLFGADHTHEIGIDSCHRKCNGDIPKKCDPNSKNPLPDSGGYCGSIMSYCHICMTGPGDMDNVVFDFHDKNSSAVSKLFTKYDVNYDLNEPCESSSGDSGGNSGNSDGNDNTVEDSPEASCEPDCTNTCGWDADGCGGYCKDPCPCEGSCAGKCGGADDGCGTACNATCPEGGGSCRDEAGWTDAMGFPCAAWRADWGFFCGDNDSLCFPGYTHAECREVREKCTKSCDVCGLVSSGGDNDGGSGSGHGGNNSADDKCSFPLSKWKGKCEAVEGCIHKGTKQDPPCVADEGSSGSGSGGGGTDVSSVDCSKFPKKGKCKKNKADCKWDAAPIQGNTKKGKGGCVDASSGKTCISEANCAQFKGAPQKCKTELGKKVCKYQKKAKKCVVNKQALYDKT